MNYQDVIFLAIILVSISIFLIGLVFFQKLFIKYKQNLNYNIQQRLMKCFISQEEIECKCSKKLFIKNFFILTQIVQLPQNALDKAYNYLLDKKVINLYVKELHSKNTYKRKRAIVYLSLFNNRVTKKELLNQLKIEQKEHIKILIVNSLKNSLDREVLTGIINSLIASHRNYQKRVITILKNHVNQSKHNLDQYFDSPLIEIKESFIELAIQIYHPSFEEHLKKTLEEIENHYIYNNSLILKNIKKSRIDRLYHQTLIALSSYYGFSLKTHKYLGNVDQEVVKIAANSLVESGDIETIKYLTNYASMTPRDTIFSDAIYKICENNKELYLDVYHLFLSSKDERKKYLLAGVLSKKIDYLVLIIKNDDNLDSLLTSMINSRYSVNIINWLNFNKDIEMENKIINIIAPIAKNNYDFYLELNQYLDSRIFKKLGFIKTKSHERQIPETEPETRKFKWLIKILIASILFIPFMFALTHISMVFNDSLINILNSYMVQINIWFIGYYVFINTFYISMAILSVFEFKKQRALWEIKNEDFLYEEGIISPISIIIPAYNEEMNIEESIRSLLSLKYPNFEIIIVNDGSKDNTLQTIINSFELKRVNFVENKLIGTNHVKAVYKNKFYSKLTLIDKVNGGKADALNVGINFSKFDYVCGIDADSIIESDGLLKMMSSVLDYDEIALALGGSIVPVNGAIINYGHIEKYNLPHKPITRFQTIEYIRAFNTGRLSFSKLKALLIISGAFGLFEKRILIEIGGYLSASSFRKLTVGEDMELVVRITRRAIETNLNHRVKYIPMARCYTEVPEKVKILFNQRNRWQRGLIETLSYHRKMLFNPKYGPIGLIAMPYFFIFEMVAPLLELQVYLSIIVGLILGVFNGVYILLLLVITTLYGIILSMISLFVQEKYSESLSIKDTFILIFYAIIENFGWRQFMNIYRSWGYLSSLRGKHKWGKMTRVGFKK